MTVPGARPWFLPHGLVALLAAETGEAAALPDPAPGAPAGDAVAQPQADRDDRGPGPVRAHPV